MTPFAWAQEQEEPPAEEVLQEEEEPEGEIDYSDGVEISNDNLADVSNTATSSATTGDNLIEGVAGDVLINTGDATAGASIQNEINTNVVEFEETDETVESVETVETEEENPEIIIENENEGTLTNQVDVLADTGENQANENGGDAAIETGDSLAYANLLNLLNTNVVGSDFELYLLNLLKGQEGDIDLNEIWKEIVESEKFKGLNLNEEESLSLLSVQNNNLANLENEVNVTATSGANQANENEGDVSIHTGNATALVNVVNIVNTNLVSSKFFLGVVNIFDSFLGDLVLPRPERFMNDVSTESAGEENLDSAPPVFENQNIAEVDDSVVTVAESGTNETDDNDGDSLIGTGNATSYANTFSLVNTNIQRNNWFFLIINNLGNWTGRIFGWSTPSATEEPGENSQIFELGFDEPTGEVGGDVQLEEDLALLTFQNQNQATVRNNILTSASTGDNQANENNGDAEIITGNARALANLFNLVNLNIWGSHWFFGLVNILGDWQGNAIFAYPDVTVSLTNGNQVMVGETVEYTLSYKNQGYDEANDVWVGFDLPQGLSFLGDSSGLTPEVSGRIYSWFLGTLEVGDEGDFIIEVQINSDFSFEKAGENEKENEVVAIASIGTTDPESDVSNNTSSVKTLVYLPPSPQPESEEEDIDQRLPILEISVWNNVGEFVYPGDTIIFEITIKNTGEVSSYETRLVQGLFNEEGEGLGTAEFEIGIIEPGKRALLSFGLRLEENEFLTAGSYYTMAQAIGYAPNGDDVSSNEARTKFEIRLKEVTSTFIRETQAAEGGEIFGTVSEYPEYRQEKDILPYVLLFLLSSMWLINWAKMKLKS